MVTRTLPRLDIGPSGAGGWSPDCEVANFRLVTPPLPGREAWVVGLGMCRSGRKEVSGSGDLE